jgi:hypothetical protein
MSEIEQLQRIIDQYLIADKRTHVLAEKLVERIALQLQTAKKETP